MAQEQRAAEGALFAVGERVRFRREVRDPAMAQIRAARGDLGVVVHVLSGLSPAAFVVKLDRARLPEFARLVVQAEQIELDFPLGMEADEVVAAAEAITRTAYAAWRRPAAG
ncbi:hypothetical protein [Sinomonas gamaensis]|uniref:hypothetical protein n=1 Tax=Sinomonas gamaensis TaxID=2565624 RepID=UPI001109B46A|nr:hypothetical protein [Sinomonas gamaensis]